MIRALDQVDALQKEILALQPIDKERQQKIDKKFRLEFNYNSNHMEGNTLTYGETELLLIFEDTKGNHTIREYDEMRNHDVAFKLVEEWARDQQRPLTEQNIKNLNEIILVKPFWKEAITSDGQPTRRLIKIGNYKEFPNSVRLQNGEIFNYTSPIDTPIEMAALMEWYRAEENNLHPVSLATMLHYKFVRIHPFDDGNGRVARLLMNYVLLRKGFPPVIIKTGDKATYLRVLHQADVGDIQPMIEYIAEQLMWSQQIVVKGAKGESIEEPEDFNKRLTFVKTRLNSDGTLDIRVTKSQAALVLAWDLSLRRLFEKIEESFRDFKMMFKGAGKRIEIFPDDPLELIPPEPLEEMTSYFAARIDELNWFRFTYFFDQLRKSNRFNLNVSITVVLHPNVFDIESEALLNTISRRYDDPFGENEIKHIATLIDNFILTAIEEHLDKKKS
jgi:Fic family protein